MNALRDFLSMGGYGAFVWPAFAVTAVIMVAVLIASVKGLRAREAELESLQRDAARPEGDHET